VPVPHLAATGRLCGCPVEGDEEGGGPMGNVVVSALLNLSQSHRQERLGAVQRLCWDPLKCCQLMWPPSPGSVQGTPTPSLHMLRFQR
jgi:hypothetical protein